MRVKKGNLLLLSCVAWVNLIRSLCSFQYYIMTCFCADSNAVILGYGNSFFHVKLCETAHTTT